MNDSLRIRACHARSSDSVSSIYCSSQEDISTSSIDDDNHKIRKQQHLSTTTQTIRRTIIYATIITSCMISISMLIHLLMNATPPFTINNPFDIMMGYNNEEIDLRILSKCDEKMSTKKRYETDMSNEQQQKLDEKQLLNINFLSFDLGGSGLKFLPLSITEEVDKDGGLVRHVTPIGKEVNLGRIPQHINPSEWIQHQIKDKLPQYKSINDWPQFGLAGRDNTYKLWADSEYDAVLELTTAFDMKCNRIEFNQLSTGCADIASDIPSWVRSKGLKYWCNKWKTANEVLGFSTSNTTSTRNNDTFRGVYSDGRAHVEGARSKLQQIQSASEHKPTSFVSWGFGTGQTIYWTRDMATNHTASGTGSSSYPGKKVASILSSRKGVSNIFEILVDIPQRILDKHISLDLDGYKHVINGPLPFWMIMSGDLWLNPSISNEDLREVYRHFFSHQVIKAIDEGLLLKPKAMVFSGGQEEHYHLAHMLSDILEERDIQAVAGYQSASHCGIARLSYPNSRVHCHFNDT